MTTPACGPTSCLSNALEAGTRDWLGVAGLLGLAVLALGVWGWWVIRRTPRGPADQSPLDRAESLRWTEPDTSTHPHAHPHGDSR